MTIDDLVAADDPDGKKFDKLYDQAMAESFIWWLPDYIESELVDGNHFTFTAVKDGIRKSLRLGEVDELVLVSHTLSHKVNELPNKTFIVPSFIGDGKYAVRKIHGRIPNSGDRFSIFGKSEQHAQ